MSSINDETWNEVSLCAWNEWKRICCVAGCSDQNQEILQKEIFNAFKRKFERMGLHDDLRAIMNSNMDWGHEFDVGLWESRNEKESEKKEIKQIKDDLWEEVENSKDPKLKVIRGKLIGPQSLINFIGDQFLKANYHEIWQRVDFARKAKKKQKSVREDIHKKEDYIINLEKEYEESLVTEIYSDGRTDLSNDSYTDIQEEMDSKINEHLTIKEIAILIADINDLLCSKELHAFVGCKKTACYERLPKIRSKINDFFPWRKNKEISGLFIFCLKKRLQAEKGAENFLLEVEAKEAEEKLKKK